MEAREAGFAIDHAVNVAGTGLSGEDPLSAVGDLFFVCHNPSPGEAPAAGVLRVERLRRPSANR